MNLVGLIPAIIFGRKALREVREMYPRVRGRVFAYVGMGTAIVGTILSAWIFAKSYHLYTAFTASDRATIALSEGRLDDALFESRLALTRFPSLGTASKTYGHALLMHKEAERAIAPLSDAIHIFSWNANPQNISQAKSNWSANDGLIYLSQSYELKPTNAR